MSAGKKKVGKPAKARFRVLSKRDSGVWEETGFMGLVGGASDVIAVTTAMQGPEGFLHVREFSPGLVAQLLPEERELIRRRFIERKEIERQVGVQGAEGNIERLQARALSRLRALVEQYSGPQIA
jgi:hypothetical protein